VDNIIGILILNHFYKRIVDVQEVDLRSLLMEPCFIHKTMKLPAVLAELKRRQTHIAIVTDEYGGTLGVLTMEDVLEQLVGDIWDETDEIIDLFKKTGENTYSVSGDMGIYDFFEELELSDKDLGEDYITVGGWAIEMLKGFPHKGDCFTYENIAVTVEETDDLRVTRLCVTADPCAPKDPAPY